MSLSVQKIKPGKRKQTKLAQINAGMNKVRKINKKNFGKVTRSNERFKKVEQKRKLCNF